MSWCWPSNHAVRPSRNHLANWSKRCLTQCPCLEQPTGFVPRRSTSTAVADAASRQLRTVTCRGGSAAAGWLCRIVERSHVHVPDRAAPTPCRPCYARCARQPRRQPLMACRPAAPSLLMRAGPTRSLRPLPVRGVLSAPRLERPYAACSHDRRWHAAPPHQPRGILGRDWCGGSGAARPQDFGQSRTARALSRSSRKGFRLKIRRGTVLDAAPQCADIVDRTTGPVDENRGQLLYMGADEQISGGRLPDSCEPT